MDKEKIRGLLKEAEAKIGIAKGLNEVEKIKKEYLGRKDGQISLILRGLKDMKPEQKKEVGPMANSAKIEIEKMIKDKEEWFLLQGQEVAGFDITLPGSKTTTGHMHPIEIVRQELEVIFNSMGFDVIEGDNLVSDYYNFESLNIPPDHPARDMQDTFFIKGHKELVMRTHTSAMQVKIMEEREPPLRVVVPGRCFRNEATDASHEHTFHQLEGFIVDKNISISNLIYTQKMILKEIFKKDVKVRLRPGYFPFVEPGFELDCSCLICDGKGCPVCKGSGWVELIPCGMIHPKVLESAGYPKGKYTGFAFGLGLTRLAMMKFGIDDIRLFMDGDLRFLKQF
ncbi:phenylalanine--tRNA ligase subunit alpha [Patescibacteria group bacterium]|nr:phenylalanine--tRNA ligase subunit alpha [Patescibacteria group bacterium]MBU1673496.1 phenylalanine--tRNA ligase subunit alpha [Patescibacteria group bacterium]MBU1963758.1 phenylalanine--tRNA ligase subunit alpha [Patescibacteria group bacterium]